MKKITAALALLLISSTVFAQSQLYIGQKITIEGRFGGLEGCSTWIVGSEVRSDVESNQEVQLCGKTSETTKYTNGATAEALTDGGTYYISGTVSGEYQDDLLISEIAKMNE